MKLFRLLFPIPLMFSSQLIIYRKKEQNLFKIYFKSIDHGLLVCLHMQKISPGIKLYRRNVNMGALTIIALLMRMITPIIFAEYDGSGIKGNKDSFT